MNESVFIEELDQAITALLRGASPAGSTVEPDVSQLFAIAQQLRSLPRQEFRVALRMAITEKLHEEIDMTETAVTEQEKVEPEGYRTVTPYLTVADVHAEIAFVQKVFGAEGKIYGLGSQGGFHSEYRIGDSMVMIGGGGEGTTWKGTPVPAALHLYVEDVDEVYKRAIAAGATSLMAPTDQEYQDRDAAVRDSNGNDWYIGTHQGERYLPEDAQQLMPYLRPVGARQMIDFYRQAFGAEQIAVYQSPDGAVQHAKIKIGSSVVELGDAHGEWETNHMNFMLYVDDADKWYARFMTAEGSVSISEPSDQPYGARVGTVADPAGNQWYIAKHLG
jgi:uncharacterized glyoxalase superfamily protein PhnB